ncbi:MAG: hypothetical protein ACFFG0_03280 [Candidatus Thorarchaeota archaeon]
MEKNKIAEIQYNWLKEFLKPLFDRLTLENVRKYKRLIQHQKKTKFNDLDDDIKEIYLELASRLDKK